MIVDFQFFRKNSSMKLHNTIKRIYQKVLKPLFNVEVLSDSGWQKIDSVNVTQQASTVTLRTKDNKTLTCALDHILIDENGNEVLAKDSLNCKVKSIDSHNDQIIEVLYNDKKEVLYDLSLNDESSHTYYTNGILSHNCIIIDEMSFIPKNIIDDFFASVMPIISSSKKSKAIVVSTPNGASGLYYDLWQEALQNQRNKIKDGWQPFRIHWWDTGGIRDEAWKRQQIAAIGIERWKQEYECDFLTSSSKKLIPDDIIEKYKMKLSEYKAKGIQPKKQKIVSPNEDALFEFDMWHEFDPKRTYLASADISEGIGGDSSVLYIWDVTDLSNIIMCAKFSSNTTSLVQFAYVASKMLALYSNPWLAAERNGVSAGMLDSLRITYGYSNIVVDNKKREPGIYSHITVKERACLWMRDMMTTSCFGFTLYDKDLLDELTMFVKKDTQGQRNIYHAMPGPNSHDDHVMAFIWGAYVLHNDRVQDHYIVVDTFTTALDQTYAHLLEPLNAYTQAQLNAVSNDPLYKEFMEYKQDAMKRSKELLEAYQREDANDVFKYDEADPYFGDNDTGSWNSTRLDWNMKPGFQQGIQRNIQLGASRGASMPSFFVV